MKIIIAGDSGYIGKKALPFFLDDGCDLLPLSRKNGFDLNTPDTFDFSKINAGDIILFLAAISSPDICANEYDKAYKINVDGTKYFIDACIENGAKILFTSSDTVYGNSNQTYDETSVCQPFGEYAKMKYEVENYYTDNDNVKILRLSYIFSKEDKFNSYLLNCRQTNTDATVYNNFYRNPAYIDDLMEIIKYYVFNWNLSPKIINICGYESLSRADMAFIFNNLSDNKINIKSVAAPEDFFDKRPKYINVTSIYMSNVLKRKPYNYKDALFKELGVNNV